MDYLSLNIDGQWANLIEGTEIALEGNNPIFSDAGSKTYLFQLNVESNRHLFGNADDAFGDSYYKTIDGKPATLYVAGIPIMVGKVSLEDEVYMDDDGCIAINLVSGNLEFAQMIEGMNCRDVELLDEIEVGYVYDSFTIQAPLNKDYRIQVMSTGSQYNPTFTFDFPYNLVSVRSTNVSGEYPAWKYCNIRRAYSIANKSKVDSYISDYSVPGSVISTKEGQGSDDILSLECGSLNSGLCFYVLYFIDCLAKKLGLTISNNFLLDIEDARRLAFVNLYTKVSAKEGAEPEEVDVYDAREDLPGLHYDGNSVMVKHYGDTIPVFTFEDAYFTRRKVVATSENFPDKSVAEVIEAVENIFNVRFIVDEGTSSLSIVSKAEVLRDEKVTELYASIHESRKVDNRLLGFKLSYSSNEDDLNFNFDNYSQVKSVEQYSDILRKVSSTEKSVFVDKRNGNAYAIKVWSEAEESGDVTKLNPSLFEIAGFSPAVYGDCSDDSFVESVELKFNPIIVNDINASAADKKIKSGGDDSSVENIYALAIDEEIEDPTWVEVSEKRTIGSIWIYGDDGWWTSHTNVWVDASLKFFNYLGEVSYTDENKVSSYNTDFMLGIMRGPGSEAGIEYFDENFDGEGNSRVSFTSANYAFTSDSIDNCNRDFDYNGTGEGGVEQAGRISLKLRAGKYDKDGNPIKDENGNPIIIPSPRAERGLYDKFWKEYAYFTVNKKIVRLRLRMEIADLVTLDWGKRYKIGDYIGFVANWNLSVNSSGVSEVEMDMYYI